MRSNARKSTNRSAWLQAREVPGISARRPPDHDDLYAGYRWRRTRRYPLFCATGDCLEAPFSARIPTRCRGSLDSEVFMMRSRWPFKREEQR